MKKKILCLIFAFCLIFPFAFVLTGCLGDPEDPLTPEEQHKIDTAKHLNTVLSDLDNLSKNVTLLAGVDGSYSLDTLVSNQKDVDHSTTEATVINNIVLKLADGKDGASDKISAEIPTVGTYYLTDSYYAIVDAQDNVEYSETPTFTGTTPSSVVLEMIDFKQLVSMVSSFATQINTSAVDFELEDGVVTVSVNINLKDVLNGIVQDYHLYKNEKISKFANAMLSRLAGKTVNIVDTLNSIEEEITANTTIGDLVSIVGEELDVDLQTFFNYYYDICLSVASGPSLSENTDIEFDDNSAYVAHGKFNTETMEVTFAEVCATKISDLLAEGESIYDYFDMALEFIDNNDTTLQSFLLNELDDETFTQITQILTAININAFEFDVDFVLDTKGKISNINVDANADVKIVDANGDGNQLLADYTVTFSVNNVGTTEINPSFKTKTLDFASINLSTTRSDVIDSSKSEIKWLLTDKPISINDFEIRGTINEEEVVLVTYTSSMQILKINKDYLEAQLDDEYNYHQFILYVEEDVDEWDSYVAINLLVK